MNVASEPPAYSTYKKSVCNDSKRPNVDFIRMTSILSLEDLRRNVVRCATYRLLPLAIIFQTSSETEVSHFYLHSLG